MAITTKALGLLSVCHLLAALTSSGPSLTFLGFAWRASKPSK